MVSEPTLVGPKSMASANKMFRLKYSCEEVYERMDKGLCIFCEELDTPGHHDLKHKGIQIFIVDDDLASDDVEEFHQTQETVTNPEPIMETAKNLDSFIEPLEHESISQVVGSVSDVMLVHKVDSHVKEVEELPQKSTSGNGENVAHQLFDQMPQRKASKEKQRKYLKAWKFKFKLTSKRRKSMDVKFFSVEEIACFTKDSKEINWGCVNKEFKEAVAGCGKKIIDRFKLVDETSKPAVCDGPIQIRVWESGGSLLQRVDEESSGDAKFHLKHKWRSRVLQTLSGLEFCLLPAKLDLRDWPKEESTPHKKKSHQIETFQVSLSSLEPGRRSHKESLVVVNDLSYDLGCVISKTNGCICDSELGQANSHDGKEFKGVNLGKLLRNEGLLSIVCLFGLNDMSCWTQLLRQQIFPKSWRFKFKTGPRESKLLNNKFFLVEESSGEATLLNTYRAVCLDVYNRNLETDLGIYLYEYKNQMLLLGYHGLEVQVLSCLQEFGEGPKTDTHIVLCWKELASFLWFLHGKKLLDAGQKMQSMLVSDFKTWVPHFGYELRLAGTDPVLGLVWSSFESDMNRLWRCPEAVLSFNSEKMGLDWFFQRDLHKSCLDIRRMIILLCSSADYRKLNLWVDTNYCEIRLDRTHVKLQEMSYFLSEKSLVEFVGYKAHGRDLLVVGVKQFTLAATKFHLKHKWRSKFGSNKLTRTWTSYIRYDSSSCALRQEENYVLVLFIIIEALTLFNDQHTLVAEKNGTETSIVLKLIFGTSQDYYLLLFLERVKATFEIMLTVEHFENPLITILSYEWFHSPRPPELSCCKEDEESTAKITSLRTRMI